MILRPTTKAALTDSAYHVYEDNLGRYSFRGPGRWVVVHIFQGSSPSGGHGLANKHMFRHNAIPTPYEPGECEDIKSFH
jgi:hypothetical protein